MKSFLLDFEDPQARYEFETTEHDVLHEKCATEGEAEARSQGLGAHVRVGLWSRRREFFAFFVDGGSLHLVAGARSFDLGSAQPPVEVRRSSILPFIKRFAIYSGGRRVESWTYWSSDLLEDGWRPRDFLTYLAREIAPRANHRKFVLFWQESAAGRDPNRDAFQSELKRVLESEK